MSDSKYKLLRAKYLEELTHLSSETIKGYRSAINSFGRFLEFKDSFDRNDIIQYLNSDTFKRLEISSQIPIKQNY